MEWLRIWFNGSNARLPYKNVNDEQEHDLISVIIPTFNEEKSIHNTIKTLHAHHVREDIEIEVIVSDGGSVDNTCEIADELDATVVSCRSSKEGGRSTCLNAGASESHGSILVFVHADTLLPMDWTTLVLEAMKARGDNAIALGAFRFKVDESSLSFRIVEFGTNLRAKYLSMPYGDQALFMRRKMFNEIGGFPKQAFMEDYELVRQIRRIGRVGIMDADAITSARRWTKLGVFQTTMLNQLIIFSYHLGIPLDTIKRWYYPKQD